MIVFFKDEEALEYFKSSKLQFMGQASVTAATFGAAADPAYNSGVAIFTISKAGLMAEASIAGAKYTFKPAGSAETGEDE
jgi:lipid-binding SYLF domain-containing protein